MVRPSSTLLKVEAQIAYSGTSGSAGTRSNYNFSQFALEGGNVLNKGFLLQRKSKGLFESTTITHILVETTHLFQDCLRMDSISFVVVSIPKLKYVRFGNLGSYGFGEMARDRS